jgi:Holliday junction resolvase
MNATPAEHENVIQLLIAKLQQEGFQQIQAKVSGCDPPTNIFLRDSGQTHTPSLVAVQEGRTFFFDIDLRSPVPLKLSRNKWEQMARWANLKYGRYFVVVKPTQVEPIVKMTEVEGLDMGVLTLVPPKTKEND